MTQLTGDGFYQNWFDVAQISLWKQNIAMEPLPPKFLKMKPYFQVFQNNGSRIV